MVAHKAFYMSLLVILGLFSSAHGTNPNKNDGQSYKEEDLGFHLGVRGKWPWDWGSHIGAQFGIGQGPNDDDFGLGFDLGNDRPTIGYEGEPSIGGGASGGGIGPGTGTGPGFGIGSNRGDDGCGGCLSGCPHCGSGSYNQPLYNQPMYCRPVNCPDGGFCRGFGLHLDLGWPSMFERVKPQQAASEPTTSHDPNQD